MIPSTPNQIPVIQSKDKDLVQTQTNVNRILRTVNNQISNVEDSVVNGTIIGEVKFASLTIEQFQSVSSSDWILANGQFCIGTAYAALTKNNSVPTITVSGANAFIKVN